MIAQPKMVDTGKLQYHRNEFEFEIENRFEALASIPAVYLGSRGDATFNTKVRNATNYQQVPNN